MLYGIVLTLHIIICLTLIAVILLQAGRGGGLSDTFGGGSSQSILGTRGAAYLTRATTAFATIFMLTSLGLAIISVQRSRSLLEGAGNLPAAAATAVTNERAGEDHEGHDHGAEHGGAESTPAEVPAPEGPENAE